MSVFLYLVKIDACILDVDNTDSDFLLSEIDRIKLDTMNNYNRAMFLSGRFALSCAIKKHFNFTKFATFIIEYCQNGKPELIVNDFHQIKLNFSLSYSTDYIAIVISTKYKIGIDIEKMNVNPLLVSSVKSIYLYAMTINEKLVYDKLTTSSKAYFAFSIWCIKESIIKLKGQTIISSLLSIDLCNKKHSPFNNSGNHNIISYESLKIFTKLYHELVVSIAYDKRDTLNFDINRNSEYIKISNLISKRF